MIRLCSGVDCTGPWVALRASGSLREGPVEGEGEKGGGGRGGTGNEGRETAAT